MVQLRSRLDVADNSGARMATMIGVIGVSLVQMAPHAVPDPVAIAVLIATVIALLVWRFSAFKLIIAGAVFGVVRSYWFSLVV